MTQSFTHKSFGFKSELSYEDCKQVLKNLDPVTSKGGDSDMLGRHYQVTLRNGVKVELWNSREAMGLKIDIDFEINVIFEKGMEVDALIAQVLKDMGAYDVLSI